MGRKGKETTVEERRIIMNLFKLKKTVSEIAKSVGRPRTTVQDIIKRYKHSENFENKVRRGRPCKLTDREKRKIIQIVEKEPKASSSKVRAELLEFSGKEVHSRTVRRVLNKAQYNARVCRKKPLISKVNQAKRLSFAKEYQKHSIIFWDKVLFSDESKFNVYRSDGRVMVWRKPGTELQKKHIQATVKHGGSSVMVWGCMAASGVGELVFIDGIMKKEQYLNILKQNMKKSAEKLGIGNDFYFQQDNDPKHTAEVVRLWLLYNTPHQLKTPPQSPDMNPIEHLWDVLDRRVRQHHITSQKQLKEILRDEWYKIEPSVCGKLVHSMPNRLKAVIAQKGLNTSY
jgi:transposase